MAGNTFTFTERCCPFCSSSTSKKLFNLSASDFCWSNWTYSEQYHTILQINSGKRFPIVRCVSCGFIYAALLPNEEFLSTLYNEVIDTKLAEQASLQIDDYVRRLRYIGTLMQLNADKPSRILDFGAGFGMSSRIIGLTGLEVVAYDSSATRQEHQVASSLQSCRNWSEVIQAGPYTAIICDNVLEHLADVHSTLQLFTEIVEKEAIIYVSVPAYEQPVIEQLQKDFAAGIVADTSLNPWEHVNYFDLYHLDAFLQEHGFQALKTCELPGAVDVGLRPEPAFLARCKNGLASIQRVLGYMAQGTVLDSVNSRFYRLAEK